MTLFTRLTPAALALTLLSAGQSATAQENPPFTSTVDTVFDIIRTDDPSTLSCLRDAGRGARQIWDKRLEDEPVVEAYLFNAFYSDGTVTEIAINPEFGDPDSARAEAERYAAPLGRLPTSLRVGVKRLSVHDGAEGFHAGTGQMVAYARTTDRRIADDHLEETLFHEAVHASWDARHRLAPEWVAAQQADGRFMTRYAASSPEREDLAETALFAFALLHHPDRLPPADSQDVRNAVPNRIAYIRELLPPEDPLVYPHGPAPDCG